LNQMNLPKLPFVTVPQVAEYLEVNPHTVRRYLKDNKYLTGVITRRAGVEARGNVVKIDIDSMYKLRQLLQDQPKGFKKTNAKLCYEFRMRSDHFKAWRKRRGTKV